MFKLSLINAKHSFKSYCMYIGTVALGIAIMSTIFAMIQDPQINLPHRGSATFKAILKISAVVIALILFWLVRYMGKYILRLRSREFASYMLMGVENKNINRLYGIEQIFLGAAATILGLATGSVLNVFLPKLIMSFVGLEYTTTFFMPKEAVFRALLAALCIYGVHSAFGFFSFRNQKIIHLLTESRKSSAPRTHIVLPLALCLSAAIASVAYICIFISEKYDVPNLNFLWAAAFIGIAAVFGISYYFPAAWIRLKTRGTNVYRVETLPLRFSGAVLRELAGKLGTVAVLAIFSLIMFNLGIMSLAYYRLNPNGDENGEASDIRLKHVQDSDGSEDCVDFDAGIGDSIAALGIKNEARVALYNVPDAFNISYFEGSDTQHPRNMINRLVPLSEYNAMRALKELPPVAMSDDECMLHYIPIPGRMPETFPAMQYYMNGVRLSLARVNTEKVAIDEPFLIVPDALVQGLRPWYRYHFWNVRTTDPETVRAVLVQCSKELNLTTQFERVNGTLKEYPASDFTTRREEIKKFKTIAASYIAVPMYIALVMLIASAAILATSLAAEARSYACRYGVLRKLGIDETGITVLIRKHLGLLFLFPALAALPAALCISMTIVTKHFFGNYCVFLLKTIVPQIGFFALVFFLYYLGTYNTYKSIMQTSHIY